MKSLNVLTGITKSVMILFLISSSAIFLVSCTKPHDLPTLSVTTVATGYVAPIGLTTDKHGRVWVAEMGGGKNDGKVTVIADGKKYDAIIGFESITIPSGEIEGPTHLLFYDGKLLILGAKGKLYKADVSRFKPGDAPLLAADQPFEDIGSFVLSYPLTNPTGETHPYNLTAAPDGSIYITDAAANAVLKRSRSGKLSVVAEIPAIANPLPIGGPTAQSVPTGVIFDNGNLLVTTLTGFPFPSGQAKIFMVSASGNVSVAKEGFTTLVDITRGFNNGFLVVQHAEFGATGFAPNTGKLFWTDGKYVNELASGMNLPAGITQANSHTWYVTSLGSGSVLRLTYK